MKTILSTSVDFIIEQSYRFETQKDNWREPVWEDEKAGTAKHNNYVNNIVVYLDEYSESGRTGKATRLELKPKDILDLAKKITEINNTSFIGIVEFD